VKKNVVFVVIMVRAINRIINLFMLIRDEDLVEHGRMCENDFTRNSPLKFVNYIIVFFK